MTHPCSAARRTSRGRSIACTVPSTPLNPRLSFVDRRTVFGASSSRGGGRRPIGTSGRELPADRDACLVGNRGDDPSDLEQPHGGGDVHDEHGDRQGQQGHSDGDGACGGRTIRDVVERQCGEGEGERGQEDAEGGLGHRGTHEDGDDARRHLRAGELKSDESDGEDHPDEREHRGRHHLEHRVGGAGPRSAPQVPVRRQAEQVGPGHHDADQHPGEDEGQGNRPETLPNPLAHANPSMRPGGLGGQCPHQ